MSHAYLWPKTEGIILESKLEKCTKYEGKTGIYDGMAADVRYKYSVNGKEYTFNRVGPDKEFCYRANPESEHIDAKNTVNKYQKGNKITVRYNPRKPHFAILEPRAFNNGFYMIVTGLAIAFGGFFIDRSLIYKLKK